MAIAKLIFNGVTQMDVTSDTVASAVLLSGYTATGADGNPISGAYVAPPTPTGTSNITVNGIYDVSSYASASVNVPIPSGYIIPTGTVSYTSNGIYDITSYASVDINVSGGGGGGYSNIIQRTLWAIIDSEASSVGPYAFYSYNSPTSLMMVSLANVTSIGVSAFCSCYYLSDISFPEVLTVGSYAFYHCSSISTVNLPKATTIQWSAFYSCRTMTGADLPEVTTISSYAFANCIALAAVSVPNLTALGTYAFSSCNLSVFNGPKLSTVNANAFLNCKALREVYFKSDQDVIPVLNAGFNGCTSLSILHDKFFPNGGYAFASTGISEVTSEHFTFYRDAVYASYFTFQSCMSLLRVDYQPTVSSNFFVASGMFIDCRNLSFVRIGSLYSAIGSNAFNRCSEMTTAIFGGSVNGAPSISANAFANCYNLLSLYLLTAYRFTLANINAFTSTPISTYTTSTGGVQGSIFVPQSLYTSYTTSTNWTTYSARFVSLTDAQISNVLQYGTHEP